MDLGCNLHKLENLKKTTGSSTKVCSVKLTTAVLMDNICRSPQV